MIFPAHSPWRAIPSISQIPNLLILVRTNAHQSSSRCCSRFPLAFVVSGRWHEIYMRTRAVRLRAQIERYHAEHGKYPISLLDIPGAPVNGPLYYERDLESPEVYYLWFGTGVGTVLQYDSKTRMWHSPQWVPS